MLLELQNTVLRMIARGESLEATMEHLCREAEALAPSVICSVLAKDQNGRMRTLAGPSLPKEYCDAIDGVMSGPNMGSCGTAAHLGVPVTVDDIEHDPPGPISNIYLCRLGSWHAGRAPSSTEETGAVVTSDQRLN